MKLRSQLLTLSLVTLLVPWFGWKLVQELERFLRTSQESALLASARTISRAVPVEYQTSLIFGRDNIIHLRELNAQPHLDGYIDDWPDAEKSTSFYSADGSLELQVVAGRYADQLLLLLRVNDLTPVRQSLPLVSEGGTENSDGIVLFLRSARGLISFNINTAAPGPLNVTSMSEGGGQLQGYWMDRPEGYLVELSLPYSRELVDLSIGALDVRNASGNINSQTVAGTVEGGLPNRWLSLEAQNEGLDRWLAGVVPQGSRAWLVDAGRWVMADSGVTPPPPGRQLSFLERMLYRAVAGSRTDILAERPPQVVRLDEGFVDTALTGVDAHHWGQDPDNALVRNSVAVPIELAGRIRGAVILEANSDNILLVTNKALGRLLFSTLFLTFGLAAGLWYFASRLSRRVQRLSGAVSEAMDDSGNPRTLPLIDDKDELGELARNNAHLLKAISNYTGYLQKLAGRLSHELKTPLAITRSSLDNLVSQDLDPQAQRYVQRAREGLDRQAAIVSAMSEANRLEAAVESSDWETVDLVEVTGHCVEAYRGVYPERNIGFSHSQESGHLYCAPDLIAQALDKLVENAISLTSSEDEVRIELGFEDDQCTISVINSGTSLPDLLPEQLFDSLVSVREKSEGRHLGLGLHIVRLVALAHKGSVSAQNLPDQSGVRFEMLLPL